MNNTMVREIRGAKINPQSSFKNHGAQNTLGRKLPEQIRYITVGFEWVNPESICRADGL
jgi:hypothetical protein